DQMSVSRRVLVAIESLAPLVAPRGRDQVDLVGEFRLIGEQSQKRIVRRARPLCRLARSVPDLDGLQRAVGTRTAALRRSHPKVRRRARACHHARGAMGAFERRPHATRSESATSKKLNGVFAASPRETWKTMADTWSAAHPSAPSTVSPGLM